jgi:neutral ceramidase
MLELQALPSREALERDAQSEDAPRRRKAQYILAGLAENQPLATNQPCPIQVVQFGSDLLLIALGGEPVADFALQFKREFAPRRVWVAGYSNDMFGYVPTRRVQQEGGYEGGRAALWSAVPMPVGESTEDRVVETVRRLAASR